MSNIEHIQVRRLATRTSLRRKKGQATVEMAFTMVILLLLVFGILEGGRLMFINSEIDNAAREGARYLALHPNNPTNLASTVKSKLSLIDTNAVSITTPSYNVCSYCPVAVTVSYQWTTLVPLLPLAPLTLQSTSTALIENTGN